MTKIYNVPMGRSSENISISPKQNIPQCPWEIVPIQKDKSMVSSKLIFKTNHSAEGSIEKYKERFVARGFSQKEGIDYEYIFAPIARYTSIRHVVPWKPRINGIYIKWM